MDTSETYIKMCDCEEIQGLAPYRPIALQTGINYSYDYVVCTTDIYSNDCKVIWLPRQDQLQEMSGLDWRSFDRKCLVYENTETVPTKEQAGIRVVMKEKHNKVWDGEKWVNAKI